MRVEWFAKIYCFVNRFINLVMPIDFFNIRGEENK